MTPLERAARAFHARSREMGGTASQWDWDDADRARCRADYIDLVRTIISAMREPDDAMGIAGAVTNAVTSDTRAVWRTMIDVMLEERWKNESAGGDGGDTAD